MLRVLDAKSPFASVGELVTIAIVLILGGCDSSQSRIEGIWSTTAIPSRLLATERSPLDLDGGQFSATDQDNYSIRLRFYRNGRLDTVTNLPNIQTQKSGRWRWNSFDDTSQTATIECELMQQRTEHLVEFVDSTTIKMVPPNMAGLPLKLEFRKQD